MKDDKEIEKRIQMLEEKYSIMGQDMKSYLDGLLYADPTYYWDYVGLDVLLNLQKPKTDFPDEIIFITYHQINELFFKLALHELQQIAYGGKDISPIGEDRGWKGKADVTFITERLKRVNNYFEALTKSFDIMIHGMEKEQFLKFRMSLLPASGFQSAQYRKVELACTDINNLLDKDHHEKFSGKLTDSSIKEMFNFIYWKQGAVESESGKKTLTLRYFEKKYTTELIQFALEYKDKNVNAVCRALSEEDRANPELIAQMKALDLNVNVNWPLVHYKSAVRYLSSDKTTDVPATGGTNWQKYLPPRHQRRIFYPELWTKEELENWGKG